MVLVIEIIIGVTSTLSVVNEIVMSTYKVEQWQRTEKTRYDCRKFTQKLLVTRGKWKRGAILHTEESN
jgi:hypothetical protein